MILRFFLIFMFLLNIAFAKSIKYPSTSEEAVMLIQQAKILDACQDIFEKEYYTWDKKNRFQVKSDGHLVSDFENSIELKIGLFLKEITPWAKFIGEEGHTFMPENKESNFIWYIDPIDGTISFKNGLDTFGLTLTLVKGKEPIATLIYFPKLKTVYTAYLGHGAYKNGKCFKLKETTTSKYHIVAHSDDYTFQLAQREAILKSLKKLPHVTRSYTDIYAYALVAEGKCIAKIDAAGALWDLFPGLLLICEAGGYARFYPVEKSNDDLYGSMIIGQENVVKMIHNHLEKDGCLQGIEWHDNKIL